MKIIEVIQLLLQSGTLILVVLGFLKLWSEEKRWKYQHKTYELLFEFIDSQVNLEKCFRGLLLYLNNEKTLVKELCEPSQDTIDRFWKVAHIIKYYVGKKEQKIIKDMLDIVNCIQIEMIGINIDNFKWSFRNIKKHPIIKHFKKSGEKLKDKSIEERMEEFLKLSNELQPYLFKITEPCKFSK